MSDIGIRGPTPPISPEFYHRPSENPTLHAMQYSVLTALAEVQKETIASTRPTQEAMQYGVLSGMANALSAATGNASSALQGVLPATAVEGALLSPSKGEEDLAYINDVLKMRYATSEMMRARASGDRDLERKMISIRFDLFTIVYPRAMAEGNADTIYRWFSGAQTSNDVNSLFSLLNSSKADILNALKDPNNPDSKTDLMNLIWCFSLFAGDSSVKTDVQNFWSFTSGMTDLNARMSKFVIAYYAQIDQGNPTKMKEDLEFFARSLPQSDIQRFNRFQEFLRRDLNEFEKEMKWPSSWGSPESCIKDAIDIVKTWLTKH